MHTAARTYSAAPPLIPQTLWSRFHMGALLALGILTVLLIFTASSGSHGVPTIMQLNNSHVAARPLTALPLGFAKTIHLVRHGQAFSNVAGEVDHAAYGSEEWFDASLSSKGWQQAEALGRHVRALGLRPQLVVVSPLTRALQTAAGAFGNSTAPHPSTDVANGNSTHPPLMAAFPGIEGRQVQRPPISSEGAPPFLAHELCREHYGEHPCDRRHDTHWLRTHFPGVDWSLISEEQDVLWLPNERETDEAVRKRGARFLAWLLARPEQEIAVVSHSGFLYHTMSSFAHTVGLSPASVTEYTRWFENCELRSFVLADLSGEQAPAAALSNFPGGDKALADIP